MKKKESDNSIDKNFSRRNFLKTVGTATAGLMVAPYLKSSSVFAYDHKKVNSYLATVAITNTSNTPADNYVYDDVNGGVKQKVQYLLGQLDGVSNLFSQGKKVAIKINMTGGSGNASSSKLGTYKVTDAMWTNPIVIQAVGQFILDSGVNPSDLYIVDSFWDTTWQTAGSKVPFGSNDSFGYKAVQTALGCNIVDLNDTTPANLVNLSTGTNYYNFSSFTVNKILQDVDVYVSIPKLKEHSGAGLTCSLKNQIGMVPMTKYTIANDNGRRGALHHAKSTDSEWNFLPETICDLNAARPVHLAVIDAIKCSTGGEGVWCTNFAPTAKHCLIAGLDPVATDSIGANLLGLDPSAKTFPLPAVLQDGTTSSLVTDNHLYLLNQKGIGTNQLNQIKVVGDGSNLITSVQQNVNSQLPMNFKLNANFPNPFNPSTMIVFYLPRNEHVTLKIYDTTGKEIETLIQGEVPAGEHRIHWTAGSLASGVYLCRMETKDFSETIKMVYQK